MKSISPEILIAIISLIGTIITASAVLIGNRKSKADKRKMQAEAEEKEQQADLIKAQEAEVYTNTALKLIEPLRVQLGQLSAIIETQKTTISSLEKRIVTQSLLIENQGKKLETQSKLISDQTKLISDQATSLETQNVLIEELTKGVDILCKQVEAMDEKPKYLPSKKK